MGSVLLDFPAQSGGNRETKTTCPYCGVGCGVIASVDAQESLSVRGDETHPANYGKLCSKGSALADTLGDEDRLLYPQIGGKRASWEQALDQAASKFSDIIAKHGPDAVAFYVSGQLLTEDYYIANKLMKGYIGSGNIDTNSRLCMASSVVGHKKAFGADTVPGCYEDLEQADLIILTGSNLAWCHPIIYQRIAAAKAARPEMKIVVIDPRETATCDIADMHLALVPGSDVALFQGLFNYLDQQGCADNDFIAQHTENFEPAMHAAISYNLDAVSRLSGISEAELEAFYALYAKTEKTVTIYSQGVNQARDGTDRVSTIINCHLLTGRIGKLGAGPFSVTGQPNAMGGREVGGLANQLASHMDIGNAAHRDLVQRFWGSPTMAPKAGRLAVDMFDAIHDGTIKAVWIMATNPVDSLPNANHVRAALGRCELVIVSDIYGHTDTAACADILLPSTGWGEKDGTVTNSERRISRQNAFLPASGEMRHDWWQLCEFAKRMGFEEGFNFEGPAEIFREYAGLCAYENNGTRDLDLSGFMDISKEDYDAIEPIQWPVTKAAPQGRARFFEDHKYFTPSGKAQFIAPAALEAPQRRADYPFILNTGRIRDQWHTMTRTARSGRLSQHISEPFIDIHPHDAKSLGLEDADIAVLESAYGQMLARVCVTQRQREGAVFVPMHFTDRFASAGRVDALVHPVIDPFSGQPASKSTPVAVSKFKAKWYGFAVVASDIFEAVSVPKSVQYWSKARIASGVKLELAGTKLPEYWASFMGALLGEDEGLEYIDMISPVNGTARLAGFKDGKLLALLYTGNQPVAVSRNWACEQLLGSPSGAERYRLLAGRPSGDVPDKGAIICSCLNVGINDIQSAIAKGCASVNAIGDATGAGTNCGSCQPEIKAILQTKEKIDVPA